MLVQKSVKLRIYPNNRHDVILLEKHFGCRRWVYNYFLNLFNENYHQGKKKLSYIEASKILTDLKKESDTEWLKEVNSQTLQSSIKDLDGAYDRFFRKLAKFPQFKSKRKSKCSFKVPQHFDIDWENNLITFPKFKRPFKFRGKYKGELVKINSVTIYKTPSGKYYASVQGEFDIQPKPQVENCIGIDLGIKDLVITSNGNVFPNKRFLKTKLKKLKYLQRQHSKKKKETNTRERWRKKLAVQYEKVTNQRLDYLHQITSQLINENQVICIENLNVKGMVKNHKLAQAISDVAWGTLVVMLNYKCNWNSKELVVIDRFYPSSKTCSSCSHLMIEMSLNVREWVCPSCGIVHDRDINAAKNILIQGLNILSGCGTQSDFKQKQQEASSIEESMNAETETSVFHKYS
jgi:putative transposase